ncbi:MAG: hypothetical protein AB8H80_22625 [Planctomycetota bacterium]
MPDALVGSTGFVGSNLRAARSFEGLFHSRNIASMRGQRFREVWFCGLPATKWQINQDPAADLANMQAIQQVLEHVECEHFVLVSTIDVYQDHAYGAHRRMFEQWIETRYRSQTTVRLPGLFGPGLKKNVLFDLLTGNRLEHVHPEDAYQWYDLADLLADVAVVRSHGEACADLFPEPVENSRILPLFESIDPASLPQPNREPRRYDFASAQAEMFGGVGGRYIRSSDQMLQRLRQFIAAWPHTDDGSPRPPT